MGKRIYFEKKEVTVTNTKGYYELEEDYTQMYNSLFKVASRLKSVVDFQLLTYVCSTSSKKGMVYTTNSMYEEFNQHNTSQGACSISKVTYHKSIKNLSDCKILVKIGKGEYQLNPFLLWKDSINSRIEITKEIQLLPPEQKELFLL